MFLTVLDTVPSANAAAMADVHLNPNILACAKVVSTAIQRALPAEVSVLMQGKMRIFMVCDVKVLPPLVDKALDPWVDWALKDETRLNWLHTAAWFLDRERTLRFEGLPQHPVFTQLNSWFRYGLLQKAVPKNGLNDWDFPVVLSKPPIGQVAKLFDSVAIYRHAYKTMTSQARMKWTGKPKPVWMEASIVKEACGLCGQDADGRICGVDSCPRRAAYNL